ncbi:MAG: winged helix-turn-helix transcriptional regulator [Bacteroidales bacterium]|nr:MAG: winged helix-turn-helix transcriptional regulator [Bacteroidales bacterium]
MVGNRTSKKNFITDTREEIYTDTSEKTSEKTSGKTSGKILELIEANNYITIPEIAKKIGITERSVERNIQKLQSEGSLKREGAAKGGHWMIIK